MLRFRPKFTLIILAILVVNLLLMFYAWRENDDETLEDKKPRTIISTARTISTTPYDSFTMDNQSKVHFDSLSDADIFIRNQNIASVPRIIIHYQNFSRRLPKFISNTDKELFLLSDRNQEYLEPMKDDSLRGVIEVVPNATFQMDYTCGYKSDYNFVRHKRDFLPENVYDVLVPLIIPMGFLFQHFFDGTLPKIIQSYEFIKRDNVKILLERPTHRNVYDILDIFGIKPDKVVWHRRSDTSTVYYAKYMLMTCVAPPIHPLLWKRIRTKLKVGDFNTYQYSERKIMLLTRAGAKNGGRNIINIKEVQTYLQERYTSNLIIFDGRYNVSKAVEIFQQVRLIIGSHGGAFYNVVYAPRGTAVVEFVPVLRYGRDIRSLPHAIFWALADMLEMDYWRVQCLSQNFQHDILVDLAKLQKILDTIENF